MGSIKNMNNVLNKITKLEESHAYLKEEISAKLVISGERKSSPRQRSRSIDEKMTEGECANILESMGQAVHMLDLDYRIIYWNQMAQNLYGYTVAEALGKTFDIITGPDHSELARRIIQQAAKGESWSGTFPVRNRDWEMFTVISTLSPSRDENETIIGLICVTTDARLYKGLSPRSSVAPRRLFSVKLGFDPQQPLQTAIASKISNMASKVKSKMKTGDTSMDFEHRQDASSSREHFTGKSTTDSSRTSANRPGLQKVLSSKAVAWVGKNEISWGWKGTLNERNSSDTKTSRFGWPWVHKIQKQELGPDTSFITSLKVESQLYEIASSSNTNEATVSWSSWTSSGGGSSSVSTESGLIHKLDIGIGNLDVKIFWDDLIIGEHIGQVFVLGRPMEIAVVPSLKTLPATNPTMNYSAVIHLPGSCGTVYHALWNGSDVAVKVFTKREYSDDVILSFRKEVSLMKRLRHPNILLFMGAVTSPQHLTIVTEFLPRPNSISPSLIFFGSGSLFQLLQQNTTKLDWRRRVHMAMHIARGMNYLHHCQPPIIHRDLKSSKLLVDKNLRVKVSDFGLSRIKHETYLTTRTAKGAPQWMAPEILRNEQADEKSDVYSYGVILWEITTGKIPWDNLNSMQVIGAVGFMNQRLEIPKDVNPQWASLIECCWSRVAASSPSSKKTTVQFQRKKRRLYLAETSKAASADEEMITVSAEKKQAIPVPTPSAEPSVVLDAEKITTPHGAPDDSLGLIQGFIKLKWKPNQSPKIKLKNY
ncbi:PAS domain-containing protein tyrosine kinase family protein [Artemisia annua]|uniref:non-specific serine/threonine protein kinase n=1 Tax=Artemisia annua TaxID=35608 RepID=A0A2U1NTV3_ARTAN|nr:PAS domain-containing protein tyrosine kinase family protein [Artemisia annua]